MESASALLQLVRDAATGAQSANQSESDLIRHLESVRNQLLRVGSAEIAPESAAIAACHVTSQVVAHLVCQRPLPATAKWQKRVFLLKTAVASAVTAIASSGGAVDAELEVEIPDKRDICNSFSWLLQRLWRSSPTPQQAVNTLTIMVRLCVLLGCCWLRYDRVGKLDKVEKLLKGCSAFCLTHEGTERLAKWALFLLGMVVMVERKEYQKAVGCFQGAVEKCEEEDGVCFYWYAVALIQSGRSSEAAVALDKCIRANYEPGACLSLQALVNLQARDFHAAAEQLQRALEIDFSQSRSFFNYALLMERMENFEAQQQLLEYALESCTDSSDPQRSDAGGGCSVVTLFDKPDLSPLFPAQLTRVNASKIQFHLAMAAMENGNWSESKQHFEEFLATEELPQSTAVVAEATRDYVYVLLQCKLPSLALKTCEHYLLKCEEGGTEPVSMLSVLMLHLYKADALLCLERVDECYEYLKSIVEPKIQQQLRQPGSTDASDAISDEVAACHTQLLNNLAVVTACRSGVDAAISLLRGGLQQYPDCLAIKFNLVLLLWRKDEKATACSVWTKARGWNLQSGAPGHASRVRLSNLNRDAAASSISEHVHDDVNAEEGVSTQQLLYLDALVLNHIQKTRDSKLEDRSLQYIEYFESLGASDIPKHDD